MLSMFYSSGAPSDRELSIVTDFPGLQKRQCRHVQRCPAGRSLSGLVAGSGSFPTIGPGILPPLVVCQTIVGQLLSGVSVVSVSRVLSHSNTLSAITTPAQQPPGWSTDSTGSARAYFWNRQLCRSSWDHPAGGAAMTTVVRTGVGSTTLAARPRVIGTLAAKRAFAGEADHQMIEHSAQVRPETSNDETVRIDCCRDLTGVRLSVSWTAQWTAMQSFAALSSISRTNSDAHEVPQVRGPTGLPTDLDR